MPWAVSQRTIQDDASGGDGAHWARNGKEASFLRKLRIRDGSCQHLHRACELGTALSSFPKFIHLILTTAIPRDRCYCDDLEVRKQGTEELHN